MQTTRSANAISDISAKATESLVIMLFGLIEAIINAIFGGSSSSRGTSRGDNDDS
jgi:hypothetical protein